MSGVNLNILQNNGIPVMGQGSTNVDLLTTSGSRWVLMNFPQTFLSSSNGGSCEGITLQWTPDPSLGFEDTSTYYAVTQSVINCEPAANSLTSSLGWYQFINSIYNASAPVYYMRAYQNKVGGGRGPYSDIVSIQTRAAFFCGTPAAAQKNGNISRVVFDVDGFDPTGSIWISNDGSGSSAAYSASFSVTPTIIKSGGPNYDAIQTNGATITVPLQGTSITQGGGTGVQIFANMALVQGSATMILGGGANSFFVTATTSSIASTSVTFSIPSGVTPLFPAGVNTINKLVGFQFFANGGFTLDNASIPGAQGGSITTQIAVTNNLVINTSADCIIREFNLGTQANYNETIYHCKYGPGGA